MAEYEYIVDKAIMTCNQGTFPVPISVTSNQMVKAGGMNVATDADKLAMANIPSFGICAILSKSSPVPCMPSLIQWMQTKDDLSVSHFKPLLSNSCANCSVGGKVEFLINGQLPMPPELRGAIEAGQKEMDDLLQQQALEENAIGEAGMAESLIPIWGSGRDMINCLQTGQWGMAALNAAFLVVDVIGVVASVFTFGAATAAVMAGKTGVMAAVKAGTKVAAKGVVKKATGLKAMGKTAVENAKKISTKKGMVLVSKSVLKNGRTYMKGVVKIGASLRKIKILAKDPGSPYGRMKMAIEFYKKSGRFTNPNTGKIDFKGIKEHLSGVDFNKPVEIVEIPKGGKLSQKQIPEYHHQQALPENRLGNYFSEPETSSSSLGIGHQGKSKYDVNVDVDKIEKEYKFKESTHALKSTASAKTDTWSKNLLGPEGTNSFVIVGEKAEATGGGTQFFVPNKSSVIVE